MFSLSQVHQLIKNNVQVGHTMNSGFPGFFNFKLRGNLNIIRFGSGSSWIRPKFDPCPSLVMVDNFIDVLNSIKRDITLDQVEMIEDKVMTSSICDSLIRPFLWKEVQGALVKTYPFKSPRLNGIPTLFYKKNY